MKSFPSYKAHRVALISVSLALSHRPDHGYAANASCGVLVYVSALGLIVPILQGMARLS